MKYISIIAIVASLLLMSSCGSTKQVAAETTSIVTYTLPGADLVTGNGLIRGWGVGKSDSEATAHKKAHMQASAALATVLGQIVKSTTEEYTTILAEGDNAASMSLLNQYIKITTDETLNGATTIFDRWGEKTADGQYVNYVVLELKGEDFLNSLYKVIEEQQNQSGPKAIDKEKLEAIFIKHINSVKSNQ